jgi:hypothetical protein
MGNQLLVDGLQSEINFLRTVLEDLRIRELGLKTHKQDILEDILRLRRQQHAYKLEDPTVVYK